MLLNILRRCFTSTERLTDRWLGRIKDLSKTNESRELYSQLSSLLEYYNMNIPEEQRKIDWDYWSNSISTPKVVEKIKATYEGALNEKYDVSKAVEIAKGKSKEYQKLDILATYNTALWWQHYLQHLKQTEALHAIGDISVISDLEFKECFLGETTAHEWNNESGSCKGIHGYPEFNETIGIHLQFSYFKGGLRPFIHNNWEVLASGNSTGKYSLDR